MRECPDLSQEEVMKSEVMALSSAVFCLDCEVISNSRGDECRACKSRSLLSLARILGGSLRDRTSTIMSA